MSFALSVKEELCNVHNNEQSINFIELEAMLRFNGEISMSSEGLKIAFSSYSLPIIRHFLELLKKFHDVETHMESRVIMQFEQKITYTLYIQNEADLICEEFNLFSSNKAQREEILGNEEAVKAYLRGAFICKGSVNDPTNGNYHLEIKSNDEEETLFIQRLINHFDLDAKISKRRNHLIIYLKDVNVICDFLRIIGATTCVYEIENSVIKREISHNVSRQLNIELANESKTFQAAKEQLKYIQYLEYNYPLEELDGKILLIMKVRKDHIDASLNELIVILKEQYGEIVTKSGLNHRFRKIKELAVNHQKQRGIK